MTTPHNRNTTHVIFDMDNGARIIFNDPRRFGAMDLLITAEAETHPLLASIGPEPLGNAFDEDYLASRLKNRRSPIKTALLDQHIVAGLGNIYVCETLFRGGVSPRRKAANLSENRIRALFRSSARCWARPLTRADRPCAIPPSRWRAWIFQHA